MRISDELIDKWKSLRSTGDDAAIGLKLDRTAASISTAIWRIFREKKCGDKLFEAIRDYYPDKEIRLSPTKSTNHE